MFVTALMLGLAGGLHCLGMCSPLVIAVTANRAPFIRNRLIYNAGRIFTYGLLGVAVNSLGSLLPISGFGEALSIALGSMLIILGLGGITRINIPVVSKGMLRFSIFLKTYYSRFLSKKNLAAFAGMGMINGLLPCGLTYLTLAYCIGLSDQVDAFFFMIVFGAGTLPVMLGLTSMLQKGRMRFKFSATRVTTLAMIAIGLLLVARSFYGGHQSSPPVHESGITICR